MKPDAFPCIYRTGVLKAALLPSHAQQNVF